jgi:hypothetical protein
MTIRTRKIAFALLAFTLAFDGAVAKTRDVPAATPDGKAESCIPIIGLQSEVRDDRTIDFTVGRKTYRNVLPQSCPELGFERAFGYETSLSQLCSTDIIHVFHQGMPGIPGASCGLGQFQPVKIVK